MSVPNVEVVSAVSGESIAVFEQEEFADASVKVLKQCLAQQIGLPRFRLQLLRDNSPLDDDQTVAPGVVQLVKMDLLPRNAEQDREMIVACEENDDKLLEQHLNKPRNPNFEDANGITPLSAAVSVAYCYCLKLVPTKTKARQMMEQRLFTLQLRRGTLKLSDFSWRRVPTKTKAQQMMEQRLFT